jgi:hypothetical protein
VKLPAAMAAILLPLFIASLINSAEGFYEYSFVALGIFLAAFGWSMPPKPVPGAVRALAQAVSRRSLGVL